MNHKSVIQVIKKVKNNYEHCNSCMESSKDVKTMYEIKVGYRNQSTMITICDDCLKELYKRIGCVLKSGR